ncbi:hypothetical protein DaAHT2_1409 [Desulfurivibrio alkaliphilus AHT 2]|uniref:Uncharacterized protein n=1 Tax=Desulfurivibrio alkaliphilus (strain DSM 19089 / UNIQEM U267 / AHT2) TaxID=589865 RepID=D6Z3H9_DESAT|nr:hypothetical protein DaAHT2_1409 [Desulfurivibrio alkaliphilus AHT 2]
MGTWWPGNNGLRATFHRPHPNKAALRYRVKDARHFFAELMGILLHEQEPAAREKFELNTLHQAIDFKSQRLAIIGA